MLRGMSCCTNAFAVPTATSCRLGKRKRFQIAEVAMIFPHVDASFYNDASVEARMDTDEALQRASTAHP